MFLVLSSICFQDETAAGRYFLGRHIIFSIQFQIVFIHLVSFLNALVFLKLPISRTVLTIASVSVIPTFAISLHFLFTIQFCNFQFFGNKLSWPGAFVIRFINSILKGKIFSPSFKISLGGWWNSINELIIGNVEKYIFYLNKFARIYFV